MKKSFLPLGVLILVVLLVLTMAGPASASTRSQLKILKQNQDGDALVGATFVISPNPHNWTAPDLTVVDNGTNDDDPTDGVLLITQCTMDSSQEYTVTETVAPPGYTPAPPQTINIPSSEMVTLIFINTPSVGANAQPVNKFGVLIPWIGLAFIVTGGITWFAIKKRST